MGCELCGGKGYRFEVVQWSDGPGMVEARCPLCDGIGELEGSVLSMALRYKRQAEQAQAELRQLKTHVALYLATSEGMLPDPPLLDATRPSSYPQTWRAYLDKAIANLPRVTEDH